MLAIWVVLHHISGRGMMLEGFTDSLPAAAQSLIHGGYLAVQTFFILSGFVLAQSYSSATWKRRDLVRYGVARLARIYPVYLLSLVVVSPFICEAMLKSGRTWPQKAGLLVDYGFLLQGWMGGLGVGWNTPAWTLSCEFFFYLFFPVLFVFMRKASGPAVLAILAACMVTPVLLAHADIPGNWKPVHHLSDFAAGIAAAKIFDRLRPGMARLGFLLYLPAFIAGALIIIFPHVMDGTYGDVNTGLRPLNVLALIGFALGGGLIARVLSSRIAKFLGKASYSMYILHVPILWWYGNWAMHGSWHMSGIMASALYLAIVIAVSSVVFKMVEMPANRWIRARAGSIPQKSQPIALAAAA